MAAQDRDLIAGMARRAHALLDLVGDDARLPLDDDRRAWTYLPGRRRGLSLAGLDRAGAKAVLRLLALGLRPHAYAQAAAVMALEDVLHESEGEDRRERHRGDYWVAVFGEVGSRRWGWRLEGHHLSVNWTVADGRMRGTPQFLGANPARVEHADTLVLAPLAAEEQLAIALLDALDPPARARATVAGDVPADILTRDAAVVQERLQPTGVELDGLDGRAAALASSLLRLYAERLPAGLPRDATADATFAWCGGTGRGEPRYYRLQARRLLVELDNTQDGANHVHSVVRDPLGDFGGDILRAHRAAAHEPEVPADARHPDA
jgi:hypothetical protein